MPYEDAWRLGQHADYAIGISISYSVIAPTSYDGSPGFTGNHQVILSGGSVYDPLADGRRPGIPHGPQKWPKALLRKAAGRLNIAPPGHAYQPFGEGRALAIIAQAPAIKPQRYSALFAPGSFWVYTVSGGRIVDRESRSFTKPTSARCTAPQPIPWQPGAARRLVMVTAGGLAGDWVEPGASHIRLKEAV
jgi:hypothetical protein